VSPHGLRRALHKERSAAVPLPNYYNALVWQTTFSYDVNGRLTQARVADGRPRTVLYATDANGQITSRNDIPDTAPGISPEQRYFYFDGVRKGELSDDGNPDRPGPRPSPSGRSFPRRPGAPTATGRRSPTPTSTRPTTG